MDLNKNFCHPQSWIEISISPSQDDRVRNQLTLIMQIWGPVLKKVSPVPGTNFRQLWPALAGLVGHGGPIPLPGQYEGPVPRAWLACHAGSTKFLCKYQSILVLLWSLDGGDNLIRACKNLNFLVSYYIQTLLYINEVWSEISASQWHCYLT